MDQPLLDEDEQAAPPIHARRDHGASLESEYQSLQSDMTSSEYDSELPNLFPEAPANEEAALRRRNYCCREMVAHNDADYRRVRRTQDEGHWLKCMDLWITSLTWI